MEACQVIKGKDYEIAQLHPGDIFGELAVLGESNRHIASVYAKTDSSVLVVRNQVMKQMVYKFPKHAIAGYSKLVKIIVARYEAILNKQQKQPSQKNK